MRPMSDPAPQEIERVFLLDRLPALPEGATPYLIEQGYLPDDEVSGELAEGRVRRKVGPDGVARCFHTIKRGHGLVREEVERAIDEATFARAWARTAGRRLRKTRWVVPHGERTWEVDAFEELDLVMAEVELPSADTEAPLPPWLAPHVVREVTEDARYRNFVLATAGLPED